MRFVADENVQRTVVEGLRRRGHDVRHIREEMPGITDDAVLDVANADGAVLLTYDTDFGELVFQQRRVGTGVILVRLPGVAPAQVADLVAAVIDARGEEIGHAFTVIAAQGVRVRQLPEQVE